MLLKYYQKPQNRNGSILVFAKGSKQDLLQALNVLPKPIYILDLAKLVDSAESVLELIVKQTECFILDTSDHLNQNKILPYFYDYCRIVEEWSNQSAIKNGPSLKSVLAVDAKQSLWWYTELSEKITYHYPIEFFKIIYLLNQFKIQNQLPTNIAFLADYALKPFLNELAQNLALKHWPLEQTASQQISTLPTADQQKLNIKVSKPKTSTVIILEAKIESNQLKSDQYLSGLKNRLAQITNHQLHLGLWLRQGPALLPKNFLKNMQANWLKKSQPEETVIIDFYASLVSRLKVQWQIKKIVKRVNQYFADKKTEPMLYYNYNIENYLKNWLLQSLKQNIAALWGQQKTLEIYFKKNKIKQCFYRNEFYLPGRVISFAAQNCGVKSISLQHGLINDCHGVYRYSANELDGPLSLTTPNYFLTWGDYYRNLFLKPNQTAKLKVISIGSDRLLDFLKSYQSLPQPSKVKSRLVVGFLTQDYNIFDSVPLVYEAIASLPSEIVNNVELLVKLHPVNINSQSVRSLSQYYPNVQFHFYNQSLAEAINVSDVIITANSTAGIEALIGLKPLIQIPIYNTNGFFDFSVMSNDVKTCKNQSELTKTLLEFYEKKMSGVELKSELKPQQELVQLDSVYYQEQLKKISEL